MHFFLFVFQIQPGEKGGDKSSARKPKDNLEGEEVEPFLYITRDYNLDIFVASLLVSSWV